MPLFTHNSAFQRVTALASQRPVHAAFAWLHGNPKTIMDWQMDLVRIPGPPFGEEKRSQWLAERFRQIGLSGISTDEVGNVFGFLPAASLPAESSGPVVLLSAHGPVFDQGHARRLLEFKEVVLICGRYEGVDERVSEHLADEELSIGNFVLSGGELAAAVVMDAVARLIPGVLGNQDSSLHESFSDSEDDGELLLDCPHYTRPAVFRGWSVPDVLLSGHHEEIRKWRRKVAIEKMDRMRPDLAARWNERPGARQ